MSGSNDAVIEVRGAAKSFGATRAVDGVDLVVHEGEIFGLIGHNGAGKTTLFKMMLGLLPPSAGEIRIGGEPVRGAGFRRVRRGIGYLPENVALYDNLTGLETLEYFARLKRADPASCEALLERVGLAHARARVVRGYSKGMRQRLVFAQVLLGSPRIVFLDEPTNGLDPQGIRDLYQILRELRAQGVTVILTSHILAEIQQRVDRLALMRSGRIQALGTVQALREALHLSVVLHVRCHGEAQATLSPALGALPADEVEFDGPSARIRCARDRKLELLEALLARCGAGVQDIQIAEPTLEDVFMGYSDAAA